MTGRNGVRENSVENDARVATVRARHSRSADVRGASGVRSVELQPGCVRGSHPAQGPHGGGSARGRAGGGGLGRIGPGDGAAHGRRRQRPAYDQFAFQFTDYFHVIGITRRGYLPSSQPRNGYDIPTRARDDIAVLDAFGIDKAVFVGHSAAGAELSRLGQSHKRARRQAGLSRRCRPGRNASCLRAASHRDRTMPMRI